MKVKASELIEMLSKHIAEKGDVNVVVEVEFFVYDDNDSRRSGVNWGVSLWENEEDGEPVLVINGHA